MCFTPAASLTTFIVEFLFAAFLLLRFKRTKLVVYSAALCFFLGLYQLTEFLLCVTPHTTFWAAVGIAAYSFLPAIGLHMSLSLTQRKTYWQFLYVVPAVVCVYVLINHATFIQQATCNIIFVTTVSSQSSFGAIAYVYWAYYFFFVLAMLPLFFIGIMQSKGHQKTLFTLLFISIIVLILPTILFLVIVPSFAIMFPSVWCHFAVLFAICMLICCVYEQSMQTKRI